VTGNGSPAANARRRVTNLWVGRRDHVAEWARIRLELLEERRLLEQVRAGRDVCWPDGAEHEPLVTVRVATFDRGPLVAERALASAVAQTYQRLEILVVGDHCTPETAAAVRSVHDSRIRFVNLPAQGIYPPGAAARRKVAGSHPMNVARSLAEGTWIAPLDDDDEFTPDHVEVLLAEARRGRYELVHSQATLEVSPGVTKLVGGEPLRCGNVAHGSVLYSAGLRFLPHSNTSWKQGRPSDWDLWDRMQRIGVRIGYLPQVTFHAYLPSAARARLAAGDDAEA